MERVGNLLGVLDELNDPVFVHAERVSLVDFISGEGLWSVQHVVDAIVQCLYSVFYVLYFSHA